MAVLLAFMGGRAWAADCTWTGTTSANWGTTTNWLAGAVPTNNDRIIFDSNSTANLSTTNNIVGLTGLSIVVTNPVGAVTIASNAFTLGASGIDCSTATQNLTISANLTMAAAQSWTVPVGRTLTASGTVANGGFLLTCAATGTIALSGIVSGTGALTKTQSGVVVSSATHTFNGGTTLSAGTLACGNAAAAGTGTLTIAGGTILCSGAGFTLANTLSITGDVTVGGNEPITLSGTTTTTGDRAITCTNYNGATFSGNWTLGGNLSISGAYAISIGGTLALGASRTVTVANGSGLSLPGVISGVGFSLTKAGLGILTVSGNNTFNGGTDLSAGVLSLGHAAGAGTGTLTIRSGTSLRTTAAITATNAVTVAGDFIQDGSQDLTLSGLVSLSASSTVTVANSSANGLVCSGVISGAFALGKSGTGVMKVSAANTFSGGFTLRQGSLSLNINSTGAITNGPVGTGTFTILGGTILASAARTVANPLSLQGNVTLGGTFALTLSGAAALPVTVQITTTNTAATTLSGLISGVGTLVTAGAQTLTLSGANTYSGATVITDGILKCGASNVLPDSALAVTGGVLDLNGNSDSIGALTMLAGTVQTGAGTLTLGGDLTYAGSVSTATITGKLALGANRQVVVADGSQATDLDVQAVVSGAFTCTKTGSGTLKLSAINTWTGATTISAGTLWLASPGVINASSAVTVASGATLTGNGNAAGTLTISGSVAPGNSAAGTLACGAVTMTSTGVLTCELGTSSDQVASTGAIALSGNLDVSALTGFGVGTYTVMTCTGTPTGTLAVRTMPSGFQGSITLSAGKVDLVVTNTASANFVWTGSSGDNKFSTAANWANGTAPSLATHNLVFRNSIYTSPVNDLAANTNVGSITFEVGGFTVSGAALTVNGTITASAGSTTLSTALTVSASRTVAVASGCSLTLGGVISGAGALVLNGAGTTTLSGASVFTGGVTLSAGTLALGVNSTGTVTSGPLGTGTLTISGGTIQATAIRSVANALVFAGDFTVGGAFAVSLGLGSAITQSANCSITITNSATTTFAGALALGGDLTLGGTNAPTFSGVVTITAPRSITNNVSAGTTTFSGGMALSSDLTLGGTRNFTISTGTITLGATCTITCNSILPTISSPIVGGFGLVLAGTGYPLLSGANTYSGGTTLNGVWLVLGASSTGLPVTSGPIGTGALTINSGVIEAGSAVRTIGNDVVIAGNFVNQNSNDLTFSGNISLTSDPIITIKSSTTKGIIVTGVISGARALTKTGPGVLTYSNTQTYAGPTTVTGGTLRLTGDTGALTGNVVIGGGATFDISNAGSLNPNRIADTATVTMNGGTWTMTAPTTASRTETIGNLVIAAGPNQVTLTAALTRSAQITSGTFSSTGGSLNVTRVDVTGTANLFFSPAWTQGVPVPGTTVTVGSTVSAATYDTTIGVTAGDSPTSATTKTTAQSGNWNDSATWVGNVAPLSTDEVIINGTHIVDLNGADRIINSLTFADSGTITGSNNLTITSGHLGAIGTGSPMVACPLAMGTAPLLISTITSNSLVISGIVTGSGGLAKNGGGLAVLTAANTFTGGLSVQSGTLTLMAANAYAGGTTIGLGATLGVGNDGALGSGTINFLGGTLRTEGGARTLTSTWRMYANTFFDGDYDLTLSGPGFLHNGSRQATVTNPSITATLSGNIGESDVDCTLLKRGLGRMILSGQNTWTQGSNGDWEYTLGIGSDSIVDGDGLIVSGPLGKSPNIPWKSRTFQTMEAIGGPRTLHYYFYTNNTCYFKGSNKITILGNAAFPYTQVANGGSTTTFQVMDADTVVEFAGLLLKQAGDNVTKQGPGTLIIRYGDYSGVTTVNGGSIQLLGDSATLLTSGVTVNSGGSFVIDGTGSANPNRLSDTSTITINGGTFQITGSATADRSETVGDVTVTGAGGQIVLNPTGPYNVRLNANVAGLTRTAGNLLLTRGSGGGGTANLFSPANYYDGQILAWASVNGSARAQYTTANGLIGSTSNLYTTIATGAWDAGATWDQSGQVPGPSDDVSIGHTISLNGADRSVRRVNLTSGVTISGTASEALSILAGNLIVTGAGNSTISCPVDLGDDGIIDQGSSGTVTLSGALRGSAGLTKNGSGTLVLSAPSNPFTGALEVNGGRLEVSGAMNYTSTTAVNVATLAVSGGLAIPDTSVITLAAGATLEVSDLETVIGTTGTDFLGSVVNLNAGGSLRFVTTAARNWNSRFRGSGNVILNASAVTVGCSFKNPANDFSGTCEVERGLYSVNPADCVPDQANLQVDAFVMGNAGHGIFDVVGRSETVGALTGDGFIGNSSGTVAVFTIGANNGDGTFGPSAAFTAGGVIGNAVNSTAGPAISLVKIGSGSQTLSGLNAYTGTTTVKAGSLIVGAAAPSGSTGALGNAFTAVLVGDSVGSAAASLLTSGAFTVGRAIVVQGGGTGLVTLGVNSAASSTWSGTVALGRATALSAASGGTCTFSGIISGSAAVTKSGLGTVVLSGANTWTGATTVAAGTLRSGAAGVIVDTVPVSVSASAVWDLAGFSETVGSIAGAGSITLGAGTLNCGGIGTSTTFSGGISGSGGLTKAGSGTLTLSGTNTHTGATALNVGALSLTGSLASGSAVTIASGATLRGTGTAAGTIAANGTIAPGVGGAGTLSTGAITMAGTTVLTFELGDPATPAASDRLACSGAITLNGNLDVSSLAAFAGGTYTLITYSGATPTNNLTVRTVPSGYSGTIDLSVANQVRLTVNAIPPTVALSSPVHCPDAGAAGPAGDDVDTYGRTFNRRPKLIWSVPSDADGDLLHFVVRLDQVDGTTQVASSSSSQTGFSWYNGSAWVAFPVGGATSGVGSVRYTPQADLTLDAAAFWTVLANDGLASSPAATVRRFLVASSAWTDASLVAELTQVRKPHIDELRIEANRIRAFRALAAASWSDTSITAHQTLIRAVHFTELRTALTAVDAITGAAVTTWAEAISPSVRIKASHISELRTAIGGL